MQLSDFTHSTSATKKGKTEDMLLMAWFSTSREGLWQKTKCWLGKNLNGRRGTRVVHVWNSVKTLIDTGVESHSLITLRGICQYRLGQWLYFLFLFYCQRTQFSIDQGPFHLHLAWEVLVIILERIWCKLKSPIENANKTSINTKTKFS